MKLLILLTLLISLALAASDLSPPDASASSSPLLLPRQGGKGTKHGRKRVNRPRKATGEARSSGAARRPSGAPARYKTDTDRPTLKRSRDALKLLPAELIDVDSLKMRRRAEWEARVSVARALSSRQSTARDFYECHGANPAPKVEDCDVVIDQVYATDQTLILVANACATFSYETCKGFFCSLCSTISVSTDFIGNQLNSAEGMCVLNGQEGTLVGESPPQWDAGFVYETSGIPYFDVC